MDNLTKHIEYLMLRHDCVVLPGIGAFINVRHPAGFDAERNMWCPMIREVRFNSAVTHDDGLLANSYARKNQTGFQEGRESLTKDLHRLKETLESDGEVTLGYLGILRLDDGVLSFRPLHSASQWAAILGYVEIPHIGRKEKIATVAVPEEAAEATDGEAGNEVAARTERRFDTERNFYIPVNKIFARTAACLIFVVGVMLSLMLPGQERKNVEQASVVPVEKLIKETAAVKEVRSEPEQVAVPAETEPAAERERYHLVVGTFKTRREAEKFISQKGETAYSLTVVESPTLSRVAALSSADRDEMRTEMSKAEFRKDFPQAWIWEEPLR